MRSRAGDVSPRSPTSSTHRRPHNPPGEELPPARAVILTAACACDNAAHEQSGGRATVPELSGSRSSGRRGRRYWAESSSWPLSWEQSWHSHSSSASGQTYEGGLAVTERSAELVADAVEPLQVLAQDVAALVATVVDELDGVQDLLATSQAILDDVGVAAATNIADITEAAADVADRLARQLELIERFIPGDTQSVAEELRALADGLQPVADQLRTLGVQLQTSCRSARRHRGPRSLTSPCRPKPSPPTSPRSDQPSMPSVRRPATFVTAPRSASDRVDLDMWLVRILVIITGVGIAVFGLITHRFAAALAAGTFAIPTAIAPPTAAPSE